MSRTGLFRLATPPARRESLGGHPPGGQESTSLATDRIIHALDGLRKAQDKDRTGTKGTLTSIKEGEKLDVFLARGCGQLTVEVCEGVYGKGRASR